MLHILGEVQIFSCKCSPYVILLLIPALGQLLELRHDQVIASLSVPEWAHTVVDLFSSVQAQDHIVHLPVDELLHLIVEQYAVRREGKAEMLVMKLLLLPSICHQVFYHLPVHERFAAEEIYFQISPVS